MRDGDAAAGGSQGVTGAALQGRITSRDGSPIEAAVVEISDVSTGARWQSETRTNGRYFVDYTRAEDGASVIAEFRVSSADPDRSRRSGRALLTVAQPFSNHNGGMIAFGPDGFLYIALGDGGSRGDPGNRAQDRDVLLGKILRIDVDGQRPYAIPEDNPFAGGGGRGEIYALGLRNPWRFSFDRASGRLWAGDVGQGQREEIDLIRSGRNYGWRIFEGTRCFDPPQDCARSGLKPPHAEYSHTGGRCAVTGGYLYRGEDIPELRRTYLFADYCSGEIFGLRQRKRSLLLDTERRDFGEGPGFHEADSGL